MGSEASAAGTLPEKEDSAIQGSGQDRELNWTLKEVVRIGGANSGPESFFRVEPSGVKVDSTGHIFILDRGNSRVLVFDAQGDFLRMFGRKGGGPKELRLPALLLVDDRGRVGVLDFGRGGIVEYSKQGVYQGTIDLVGQGLKYKGDKAAAEGNSLFLTLVDGYRSTGDSVQDLLIEYDGRDTAVLASIQRPRPVLHHYSGCVGAPLLPLFSVELNWDADGGMVVVNNKAKYELSIIRNGELSTKFGRNVKLRSVGKREAIAELGEGTTVKLPDGRRCRLDPHEQLEARGFNSVVPAIANLAISPAGEIWVQRKALRGEPSRIDIFTAGGDYLGSFEAQFPAAFMPDGSPVLLWKDELDVQHLSIYEIVR